MGASDLPAEAEILTNDWVRIAIFSINTGANDTADITIIPAGQNPGAVGFVDVWGAQLEQRPFVGPYTESTGTIKYNNSIPAIVWKVMRDKGAVLDTESIMRAEKLFSGEAQYWRGVDNIRTGEVVDALNSSGSFYLINDFNGKFITGRLELPKINTEIATWETNIMLGGNGRPKIKSIPSKDPERGIPIFKVTLGYDQNYTIMDRQSLTGSADTEEELNKVNREFALESVESAAVLTKFPNAFERVRNTQLVSKSDATIQADHEQKLFRERRPIVEIKIPIEFARKDNGDLIAEDDVILADNLLYRIIGKKLRFPSARRRESSTAITYQCWGGISPIPTSIFTPDFTPDFE